MLYEQYFIAKRELVTIWFQKKQLDENYKERGASDDFCNDDFSRLLGEAQDKSKGVLIDDFGKFNLQ